MDGFRIVARPASNKAYRVGVLLNNREEVVRTCGHTRTHTSSKAATDCLRNALKGTHLIIEN